MEADPRPWGVLALVLFLAASLLHRALTEPAPPAAQQGELEARVPGVIALGPAGPDWRALLAGERVDINLAPEPVLRQLPGIGPKLAARIVRERERRPFLGLSDLTRVRGLGARSVAKLRPHVRFSSDPVAGADAGPGPP